MAGDANSETISVIWLITRNYDEYSEALEAWTTEAAANARVAEINARAATMQALRKSLERSMYASTITDDWRKARGSDRDARVKQWEGMLTKEQHLVWHGDWWGDLSVEMVKVREG